MIKLTFLFVLTICLCKDSKAKVPLSEFFPFGTNNSDVSYVNLNRRSDDGFSAQIDLDIPFPFFDNLHNSLWVNINGAISFLRGIATYTPICAPVPQDFRMIAPFWADIDLRRGGDIYYRQTYDELDMEKVQGEINNAFPEMRKFKVNWAFITTWYNVSFYGSGSCTNSRKQNTFQSILATNGVQSFAIFLYNEITWTLGTASGGDCSGNSDSNTAKVGFDAGDGISFENVPDSCKRDIISINEKSNYGHPGQWVFRVDNSEIQSAGCKENFTGSVRVFSTFVDMFGHVPIEVLGPCYDENTKMKCRFHDPVKGATDVPGYKFGNDSHPRMYCNTPFIFRTGRIKVDIILKGKNETQQIYPGHLNIIAPQEYSNLKVTNFTTTESDELNLVFEWDREFFTATNLELKIFTYHHDQLEWKEFTTLVTNIGNSGEFSSLFSKDKFPLKLFDTLWSFSLQELNDADNEILRIKRRHLMNYVKGAEDSPNEALNTAKEFASQIGLWSFSKILDIYAFLAPIVGKECQEWYDKDSGPPDDLPPCPPTTEWAISDPRFRIDPACSNPPCEFHPGADFCTRSTTASPSGGGQQCCYKGGKLLIGPPGGGTVDKCHFSNAWCHVEQDVLPWAKCCKGDDIESCNKYYKRRPSNNGAGYEPPMMAAARGDPHITTFDNFDYTFNGAGDFWMIKNARDMPALVQARMEPVQLLSEKSKKATVFSAFFMKCGNSSSVQIQSSVIRKADIFIDDIAMDMNDPVVFDMTYQDVHIYVKEDLSMLSISFACGFNFNVHINNAFSIIASCDKKFKGRTHGLLGIFDGKPENDLQDPDGNIISPSSSLRDIHYKFGLKWRVTKIESLFINSNKNYEEYNLEEFTPSFEEPDYESAPIEAKEVCGMSKDCLYDYQITGSPSFAKQTKIVSETLNMTIEVFKKAIITCPPLTHPDNGYFQTENFFPGSDLTYYCNTNYTLKGNAFVSCSDEGLWNGTVPVCYKNEQDNLKSLKSSAYSNEMSFIMFLVSTILDYYLIKINF